MVLTENDSAAIVDAENKSVPSQKLAVAHSKDNKELENHSDERSPGDEREHDEDSAPRLEEPNQSMRSNKSLTDRIFGGRKKTKSPTLETEAAMKKNRFGLPFVAKKKKGDDASLSSKKSNASKRSAGSKSVKGPDAGSVHSKKSAANDEASHASKKSTASKNVMASEEGATDEASVRSKRSVRDDASAASKKSLSSKKSAVSEKSAAKDPEQASVHSKKSVNHEAFEAQRFVMASEENETASPRDEASVHSKASVRDDASAVSKKSAASKKSVSSKKSMQSSVKSPTADEASTYSKKSERDDASKASKKSAFSAKSGRDDASKASKKSATSAKSGRDAKSADEHEPVDVVSRDTYMEEEEKQESPIDGFNKAMEAVTDSTVGLCANFYDLFKFGQQPALEAAEDATPEAKKADDAEDNQNADENAKEEKSVKSAKSAKAEEGNFMESFLAYSTMDSCTKFMATGAAAATASLQQLNPAQEEANGVNEKAAAETENADDKSEADKNCFGSLVKLPDTSGMCSRFRLEDANEEADGIEARESPTETNALDAPDAGFMNNCLGNGVESLKEQLIDYALSEESEKAQTPAAAKDSTNAVAE